MDAEHNAERSEADPPVRGKSAPSAATIAQFSRKGIPRARFFHSAFDNVALAQWNVRVCRMRRRAPDHGGGRAVRRLLLPGFAGAAGILAAHGSRRDGLESGAMRCHTCARTAPVAGSPASGTSEAHRRRRAAWSTAERRAGFPRRLPKDDMATSRVSRCVVSAPRSSALPS